MSRNTPAKIDEKTRNRLLSAYATDDLRALDILRQSTLAGLLCSPKQTTESLNTFSTTPQSWSNGLDAVTLIEHPACPSSGVTIGVQINAWALTGIFMPEYQEPAKFRTKELAQIQELCEICHQLPANYVRQILDYAHEVKHEHDAKAAFLAVEPADRKVVRIRRSSD